MSYAKITGIARVFNKCEGLCKEYSHTEINIKFKVKSVDDLVDDLKTIGYKIENKQVFEL